MSTTGHSALRVCALALGALLATIGGAAAQDRPLPHADEVDTIEGLAEWSDAVQAGITWPSVPFPAPSERPADEGLVLRSALWPVAVHAEPGVPEEHAAATLAGLEQAAAALDALGWPAPPYDGGRGGGSELDLYLRVDPVSEPLLDPQPLERLAPLRYERAGLDVPTTATDVDGAVTFAEMSDAVDPALVPACALTAYADAMLLAMDPAESPQWRRATAVYLAHLVTGRFGCDESRVVLQQRESWRGFVSHDPSTGEGGALLVGAISARHDEGTGSFVRDLWNATRQWSRDAVGDPTAGMHALPDYYYVLAHGVALAHDPLTRIVEDFGASRWLAGARRPPHGLAYPILAALPPDASVPAMLETRWSALPRSVQLEGVLEPYGSAYAVCDVREAPPGSQLRVWLRGEFGVEWALVALRLDANGEEMARMRAPPRPTPRSFLPVELLEGTATVVIVVTSLGARGLDADQPDDFSRTFRLALDQRRDDAQAAADPE